MGAWPVDERITGERRPRPKRWLLFALVSFVAIFVVAGLAPEFEDGEDPTAPWAVAFVIAGIATLVGLTGAVVSAIRARRYRAQHPTPEAGDADRAGRRGLYVAFAGFGLIVVTMIVRQGVTHPAPEDDLDLVSTTFATIGLCVVIAGLSYWGMTRGRLAAERRMERNLEGQDRTPPTDEEEASLQLVFARMAERAVNGPPTAHASWDAYWTAAAGNPTDVREAELTLPVDPAAARALGVDAITAFQGEILDARDDLLRGWWFEGSLNGNPVVITLSFEPDGLGGTRVRARSVVKFYLTNQDLAREALDRMIGSLDRDARAHVTADAAPVRPDDPQPTGGVAPPADGAEVGSGPVGAGRSSNSRSRFGLSTIIGAAVLALFVFGGIRAVLDAISYSRYGGHTTGTVLEVDPREGSRRFGADVVVRYEVAGQTYTVQTSNEWSSDIDPGDEIGLTYDARDPTRVSATPLFYLYFRGLAPLVLLGLLIVPVVRRARGRRSTTMSGSPIGGPAPGYG